MVSISKNIHQRINNTLERDYQIIKPINRQGIFNYKCYFNAVQFAEKNNFLDVVQVFYIDNNKPILHYINYDRKSSLFLETTLGFLCDQYTYYYIDTVPLINGTRGDIQNIFIEQRHKWIINHSTWLERFYIRYISNTFYTII